MKVSPIESSRGKTPIVSIRRVVPRQPFPVHDAESLLRCAPRILFRPPRPPSLFFLRLCSSCRPTLLPSPLFSFFFFVSLISLVFFSPFRFCSTSLSLGYSTIRPPVDIKLHKQRGAPEGLFALQQIFSDCSRAVPCRMYGVRVVHYVTHY